MGFIVTATIMIMPCRSDNPTNECVRSALPDHKCYVVVSVAPPKSSQISGTSSTYKENLQMNKEKKNSPYILK